MSANGKQTKEFFVNIGLYRHYQSMMLSVVKRVKQSITCKRTTSFYFLSSGIIILIIITRPKNKGL